MLALMQVRMPNICKSANQINFLDAVMLTDRYACVWCRLHGILMSGFSVITEEKCLSVTVTVSFQWGL